MHPTCPDAQWQADPFLKTQLSSVCERNCFYCPFRAGRDFRRATFRPDEFANLFLSLVNARATEGIFLSSGIAGGGVRTQDQLLATAEILRKKLGFRGYIHLKIMPGAEKAQVEQAMLLANRVSINLEAPNPERLSRLAPQKIFTDELLRPLRWVDEIRQSTPPTRSWNGYWPSSVTQFVAGGSDESDIELLSTSQLADEKCPPEACLLFSLQSHPRYATGKQTRNRPRSGASPLSGVVLNSGLRLCHGRAAL